MIEENILVLYGAIEINLEKGAFLFHEKERAANYFQVKSGKIKMFNLNAEGKLFTQGMFEAGESFGEPPLLLIPIIRPARLPKKIRVCTSFQKPNF